MISFITEGAHRLDGWLRERLGRSYSAILGAGLVLGIISTLHGLGQEVGSGANILKIVGIVLFQLVLLINQLSQFFEYRQERRVRREERRERRAKDSGDRQR
jgi:hypothetical protein